MKYCNAFFKTGIWWIKQTLKNAILPMLLVYIVFRFLEILSNTDMLHLLGYATLFLAILVVANISYDKYMEFLEEEEDGGKYK